MNGRDDQQEAEKKKKNHVKMTTTGVRRCELWASAALLHEASQKNTSPDVVFATQLMALLSQHDGSGGGGTVGFETFDDGPSTIDGGAQGEVPPAQSSLLSQRLSAPLVSQVPAAPWMDPPPNIKTIWDTTAILPFNSPLVESISTKQKVVGVDENNKDITKVVPIVCTCGGTSSRDDDDGDSDRDAAAAGRLLCPGTLEAAFIATDPIQHVLWLIKLVSHGSNQVEVTSELLCGRRGCCTSQSMGTCCSPQQMLFSTPRGICIPPPPASATTVRGSLDHSFYYVADAGTGSIYRVPMVHFPSATSSHSGSASLTLRRRRSDLMGLGGGGGGSSVVRVAGSGTRRAEDARNLPVDGTLDVASFGDLRSITSHPTNPSVLFAQDGALLRVVDFTTGLVRTLQNDGLSDVSPQPFTVMPTAKSCLLFLRGELAAPRNLHVVGVVDENGSVILQTSSMVLGGKGGGSELRMKGGSGGSSAIVASVYNLTVNAHAPQIMSAMACRQGAGSNINAWFVPAPSALVSSGGNRSLVCRVDKQRGSLHLDVLGGDAAKISTAHNPILGTRSGGGGQKRRLETLKEGTESVPRSKIPVRASSSSSLRIPPPPPLSRALSATRIRPSSSTTRPTSATRSASSAPKKQATVSQTRTSAEVKINKAKHSVPPSVTKKRTQEAAPSHAEVFQLVSSHHHTLDVVISSPFIPYSQKRSDLAVVEDPQEDPAGGNAFSSPLSTSVNEWWWVFSPQLGVSEVVSAHLCRVCEE